MWSKRSKGKNNAIVNEAGRFDANFSSIIMVISIRIYFFKVLIKAEIIENVAYLCMHIGYFSYVC